MGWQQAISLEHVHRGEHPVLTVPVLPASIHGDLLHEVFGFRYSVKTDVAEGKTASVRVCENLHALQLCLRVRKGVDVADGLVARAPVIDLLGGVSASAAPAQRLWGGIRYEEECPVKGLALAVGRTTTPVVGDTESKCVGRNAHIGHDWLMGA